MELENRPKVGIGIIVFKDQKILLGKRKGSHGAGQYSFPGGHLEYMESFEDCVEREIKEETGIEVKNIKFSFVTNLVAYKPKHYVHLGFIADWKNGEPKVLEPEKCEGWNWYDLDNLPEPLFFGCKESIEYWKNNTHYSPEIK